MISTTFIKRPKLAMVIAVVTVMCGLIAIPLLPVGEFPNITPPQVTVSASYPGANAQTVIDAVAGPIEQEVNGVENMIYMQSTASNSGNYSLSVTFEYGTDPDLAQVNVQNRVDQALRLLPEEVSQGGVRVQKQSTDMLMVINVFSPEGTLTPEFISNYSKINVSDVLARINGISAANNLGSLDFAMRVWLNPDRMASLGLATEDVVAAIREQNLVVAAGQVGAPPAPKGQQFQYTITTRGRLASVEEFEQIVVRAGGEARIVYLKDIARIELGAQSYAAVGELDGQSAAVIAVYKLPEANALAVADDIRSKLDELSQTFPEDLDYAVLYDTTRYVSISIKEVVVTLLQAVALVILVVFLFLGNWRATLVPAVTIPVSLIGTFAVLLAMGMSINTVSLFGLILAIGVVVDDAIIVIENVERHIAEGKSAFDAAMISMKEVTGPIVATTLVLFAVFVPVTLMPGISGSLYRQFAITILVAVFISSINALTLSPALSALILKHREEPKGFLGAVARLIDRTTHRYRSIVDISVRRLGLTIAVYLVLVGGIVWMLTTLPSGFVPDEDKGAFMVDIQLPDAASLERTGGVVERVSEILEGDPEVQHVIAVKGYSLLKGVAASNGAMAIVVLRDWEQRPRADQSQAAVANRMRGRLLAIPDAMVTVFSPPALPGVGAVSGVDYRLLDQLGRPASDLAGVAGTIVTQANQAPEIGMAFSTFRAGIPLIEVEADRVKAKDQGIALANLYGTLQAMLGSLYVNDFNLYGRTFRVMIQADAEFRDEENDISRIFVRNNDGEMVPLSTLVSTDYTIGPETLNRYNLFNSVTINAMPAPGYSESDVIGALERISASALPSGYTYDWSGMTFQSLEAGNLAPIIFSLALVFVYLFLVGQYESWLIPAAVILSVPLAILGAFAGLHAIGLPLNLYGQIGLVLLVGMSAKTAILIVEFAKQLRDQEHVPIAEAAGQAASIRFRAVLMTGFSFILGVLPLILASGAGAASRVSLGTVVFYGMIASAIFGTLMVPAAYAAIQHAREFGKKRVSGA
ncbi:efflux RND transporter permease subunit [Marinihelvus fidelis]|uniref:Efflux pump membrane transporter n=1 Tax=Marinihelvus fidelis TaxID=2613842 RepID=A0A5N0T7N6_9GAMM|nr:multidrug efflux RND transporter permease subunit [Marinihelvus fidelis]KAA9130912.1 efflux RND transporter permease subunit [Marinihelvus fidelis]